MAITIKLMHAPPNRYEVTMRRLIKSPGKEDEDLDFLAAKYKICKKSILIPLLPDGPLRTTASSSEISRVHFDMSILEPYIQHITTDNLNLPNLK